MMGANSKFESPYAAFQACDYYILRAYKTSVEH